MRLEAPCPRLTVRAAELLLQIHKHPKLGWHEKYAHRVLTDYLEKKQGFNVTRGAYNLSTAFIAEYSNGNWPYADAARFASLGRTSIQTYLKEVLY